MKMTRVYTVPMTVLALAASFAFAGESRMAVETAADRPNVVVVMLDDFGAGQFAPLAKELEVSDIDPGFLAYTESLEESYDPQVALEASKRAMPFMDKLAEKGAVFTQAYSSSNLCSPARQGLLTGTHSTRWGAYRVYDVNICGLPEGKSLASRFQDLGYKTGTIGKWHVGSKDYELKKKILAAGGTDEDVNKAGWRGSVSERDHPHNHGFDYAYFYNFYECPFYDSELIWDNRTYTGVSKEYNTDLFTRKAMEFMGQSLDEDKPFFVNLAYHTAHMPLTVDAPQSYTDYFDTGSKSVDRFYSHIYAVDQSIKRIVDLLKARGAWENTILFVLSDNGATCKASEGDESLIPGNGLHRGHKGQHFLGGFRIPMMMVWPDKIKTRTVINQNVSSLDVLPTGLAAAGAELPDGIDGKDLMSVVEHPDQTLHEQLFFAGIHAPAWGYSSSEAIGIASERRDLWPGAWAIVEGDYVLRFIGTLAPGLEHKYPDGRKAYYSLHNMKEDPLEQNNLMATKPELAERMKADYMKTADTLEPPYRFRFDAWAELVPHPERYPADKRNRK